MTEYTDLLDTIRRRTGIDRDVVEDAAEEVVERLTEAVEQDDTLAAALRAALLADESIGLAEDVWRALLHLLTHRDLPSAVALLGVVVQVPPLAGSLASTLAVLTTRIVDAVKVRPADRARRVRARARTAHAAGKLDKAKRLRDRARRIEVKHDLPGPPPRKKGP